ncbi:hypothetical protein VR7878_01464 [Vibrio ruber DSM 16370]|uniref:Zn-ribbon-containing, possibly RNA-binding protein and truncated derivatives n=1 Tax=Vibrio ruber (strain DSM 16370 / JCM 11486 / BCRC 17186 / CECT 7878 / LMG 23124 / VR1) TaxID=1123498 RepID=A0A1R4LH22_VIBR1|nr:DciA family protein [Vibrio ruber]SJN55828.1 hypothetical protein VR7878_01464 [Vibrio ruber DSM 16370]
MRNHRPTATNELISHSKLKEIQKHAESINQLSQIILPLLPKGTQPYVRVANLRRNNLVLEVASAAIKMKLDYERLQILNHLRNQGFAHLVSLEVVINPSIYRTDSSANEDKTPKNPRIISSQTADLLKCIADHASPKVKKRLENIACLANKKDK